MQNETYSSDLTLTICGGTYMLDPWELMRWIVQKTLQGQKLYCKGTWASRPISGQLLPHSIDRTQRELTRCLYVDVLTDEGTYTTHCKNLTYINTHP